jgi:ABC-type antimicrobial peptide transport system permease subunit
MNIDTIIQIIQLVVTILGLVFIWIQISRSRKDALTGSFISSLAERWLAIDDRRGSINDDDIKVYYKYLIPELNDMLKTKYQGNLASLASDYVFNDDDRKLKSKEKIFAIILREYADIDAIFNYCEEEFIVAKHLKLVNKKLWDYWEFYLALNFR